MDFLEFRDGEGNLNNRFGNNRTTGLFILFVTLLTFPAWSMASSGPVKLRLTGKPKPAVAGEPYSVAARITVAIDAEITNFGIEPDGWRLDSMDFPGSIRLNAFESRNVNLLATPSDTSKPLVIFFYVNGRKFQKEYVLSQERYDRLKKITDPSDVENRNVGLDPGPPPQASKEVRLMFREMMKELREVKRELRNLRAQLATKGDTDLILGGEGEVRMFLDVPVVGEPTMGLPDAPVTLVEYGSFDCPVCGRFAREVLPELRKEWIDSGKVRYVFKVLSLSDRPEVRDSAAAAYCAAKEGKFWKMHELLFSEDPDVKEGRPEDWAKRVSLDTGKFGVCEAAEQTKNKLLKLRADAEGLGIRATPTFVLGTTGPDGNVKGEVIKGIRSLEFFRDQFKAALE